MLVISTSGQRRFYGAQDEPQTKMMIHEAINKLEKALEVSNRNDKTLFLLGIAHSSLGDDTKAVGYFREAQKKNHEERIYKLRSLPGDYTWLAIGALIWCFAVVKIIFKK
ncbi:hypothetical protein C5167_036203 [Papaver somniferum]|nr:hypothetical protein C5167_036203 [Papaver somniferum]